MLNHLAAGINCARRESPIPVPEMQSAFHPHAERNAFRRRDVRLQQTSFVPRVPPDARSSSKLAGRAGRKHVLPSSFYGNGETRFRNRR